MAKTKRKPTPARKPRKPSQVELDDQSLAKVAGGFNPQPEPPGLTAKINPPVIGDKNPLRRF